MKIFIFCGESSADLHGHGLMRALRAKNPHLEICGVGGPKMRSLGMKSVAQMEDFQVMGFVDVFLALPHLMRKFFSIRRAILENNPRAVVFIDYPGFNLRMAKSLRKKGFKGALCQYISPSVWAWGKKRIPLMENTLDLLLSILPFEKQLFSKLKVDYVGHPLAEKVGEHNYAPLPFEQGKRVVGIFPGSRRKEIERNFPLFLKGARHLLSRDSNLVFGVSVSNAHFAPLLEKILADEGLSKEVELIPAERTYDLMRASSLAMAKSGTVTLELALHHVPTVVGYAISPLDLFIAKDIFRIRLPHYCLVNIIGNETVFPELFGPHFTEKNLFSHLDALMDEKKKREECVQKCKKIAASLQTTQASSAAAESILGIL